jgi:hypothetical protein
VCLVTPADIELEPALVAGPPGAATGACRGGRPQARAWRQQLTPQRRRRHRSCSRATARCLLQQQPERHQWLSRRRVAVSGRAGEGPAIAGQISIERQMSWTAAPPSRCAGPATAYLLPKPADPQRTCTALQAEAFWDRLPQQWPPRSASQPVADNVHLGLRLQQGQVGCADCAAV